MDLSSQLESASYYHIKANVPQGTYDKLVPPKEVAEDLKENVIPLFQDVYKRARSEFTPQGWKIVERALKKPTLRSGEGVNRLYEPALILGLTTRIDLLWEIYEIGKKIPFWGFYAIVECVAPFNNILYTKLALANDPRGDAVEQQGSRFDYLEDHGGVYDNFTSPMPAYQWNSFSYNLNELYLMWANGGSDKWPRERIEDALDRHAEFLRPWLVKPPVWGIDDSPETLPESLEAGGA
ncbi:hypothetical protein LIA77_06567 [Sarocladium implicatum]|nr:hypothetical protein LIA77_06567 [Sarocladium implicatum]